MNDNLNTITLDPVGFFKKFKINHRTNNLNEESITECLSKKSRTCGKNGGFSRTEAQRT